MSTTALPTLLNYTLSPLNLNALGSRTAWLCLFLNSLAVSITGLLSGMYLRYIPLWAKTQVVGLTH